MSVKEQVRMLWATCFHDSEAFMDLYFGCRYADSLNEYMESDGRGNSCFATCSVSVDV